MSGGNASDIFKFCSKLRWFISSMLLLLYTQGSCESLIHLFAYLQVVLMEVFLLNYRLCFLINCIPLQIRYYMLDAVITYHRFVYFICSQKFLHLWALLPCWTSTVIWLVLLLFVTFEIEFVGAYLLVGDNSDKFKLLFKLSYALFACILLCFATCCMWLDFVA